ncbi:MAG: tetratricopeptide repeat protein [Vicinamibacterales bacterium]
MPTAFVVALLFAATAAWAYSTSFAGVFVMDDKFAIADNPNIKSLWPLTTAMSAPAESPVSGRPVASLTLAINYALAPADVRDVLSPGGPSSRPELRERFLRNAWGYHLFNLVLHVFAALALFGVIRRTLRSHRLQQRLGAASTGVATVASMIWLVHPLLTDAVTYVVQRTEVLMGLFFLLTLYCSIRASEPTTQPRARRLWTIAAIAACALGMGSKQTMVTAPIIVWLWDWMFASETETDPSARAARRRWLLYAGLAATWILLAALVALERWPHSIGIAREGWTPWTYLLTQSGVVVHYVRLAVVAAPLSLDNDGWPMVHSVLQAAPYALPLVIVLLATVLAIVRCQPWGFLGAWFFVTLAPSSSVLPLATEIAAERRMYLPLASLVVAMVVSAYLVGQRLLAAIVADPRRRRRIGIIAAVIGTTGLAGGLGSATYARNRDYWSDERIWQDTVEKRPSNSRARVNYGIDLYAAGRLADAERELREAVRLKDTDAAAHATLGPVLAARGQLDEGIFHLERALVLDPDYTPAHANLAEAYAARGTRARAAEQFARAVEIDPDNPFLLNRLAWLLATSPEDGIRDGSRAVKLAEHAVSITGRQDIMSLETLSAAYAEVGRFDDAVSVGREALSLAERQRNDVAARDLARRVARFQMRQKYRE